MKPQDSYKLLFNNLWIANPERINILNPNLIINNHFNKASTTALESLETENKVIQTHLPTLAEPIIEAKPIASMPIKHTNNGLNWDELTDQIVNCTKCNLCYGRKNVVIERGNRSAPWLFIGEGPGEQEDMQAKPFVGPSGQLLDKMIVAMKLDPMNDVYICNVVKCRPPFNRNPEAAEVESCKNYLFNQIKLVKPKIIITLGRFASQTLLNNDIAIGKLRNTVHQFEQIPVIVTFHPSYLLRNVEAKKDAWADLQLAMKTFGNSAS